jgi:uncharacterized membrane protein YecN with MAPEG domain
MPYRADPVQDKVLLGDGGQPLLLARTRAHANFVEYALLVLILMGLIEAGGGGTRRLATTGGVFAASWIAHAIGMDRPTSNLMRAGGAMLTWAVLPVLAIWGLVLARSYDSPAVILAPIKAAPTA